MKKLIFGILVAFSVVSVSFGVDLYGNEENYQKLKAEMEEAESLALTNFDEDKCFNGDYHEKAVRQSDVLKGKFCRFKNVLAFFDELRAMEVEKDNLNLAIAKVREMPRFKEDSGIYSYVEGNYKNQAVFNDYAFWKRVFEDWKIFKIELRIYDAH